MPRPSSASPARKTIAPAPSPNSTSRWRSAVFAAKSSGRDRPGVAPLDHRPGLLRERHQRGVHVAADQQHRARHARSRSARPPPAVRRRSRRTAGASRARAAAACRASAGRACRSPGSSGPASSSRRPGSRPPPALDSRRRRAPRAPPRRRGPRRRRRPRRSGGSRCRCARAPTRRVVSITRASAALSTTRGGSATPLPANRARGACAWLSSAGRRAADPRLAMARPGSRRR